MRAFRTSSLLLHTWGLNIQICHRYAHILALSILPFNLLPRLSLLPFHSFHYLPPLFSPLHLIHSLAQQLIQFFRGDLQIFRCRRNTGTSSNPPIDTVIKSDFSMNIVLHGYLAVRMCPAVYLDPGVLSYISFFEGRIKFCDTFCMACAG